MPRMDCTVVYKWERDPQTARVSATGAVDWGRARPAPSDDDHAVLALARALATSDRVTAVTVDGGDLAWAAARGASSTLVVDDAEDLDTSAKAAALAAAAATTGDQVILIGDSVWNRALPVALAAALDRPCIAQVRDVHDRGDGTLRVTRRVPDGDEVIDVPTPVVLAVAARTEEKGAPGMKDVLKARKAPRAQTTPAELGTSTRSATSPRNTRLPDTVAVRIFSGSTAIDDLLGALRAEGVL